MVTIGQVMYEDAGYGTLGCGGRTYCTIVGNTPQETFLSSMRERALHGESDDPEENPHDYIINMKKRMKKWSGYAVNDYSDCFWPLLPPIPR